MLNKLHQLFSICLLLIFSACTGQPLENSIKINTNGQTIKERILPPTNYKREVPDANSFGAFLQNHKVLAHGSPVKLHSGGNKHAQNYHVAVLDRDVGSRDLQQCADAVIRLHAEYLYAQKKYNEIAYNFVSDGKPRYFLKYSKNKTDYGTFRKYLNYIFSYANTRSLHNQLIKVDDFNKLRMGDVLIQIGRPYGHAVIIVDVAVEKSSGKKAYLLAQSYMPAQSIHILKNPISEENSPWYIVDEKEQIRTPEWTFQKQDLRRFKN